MLGPFDAGLRREARHDFEGGDELGTAVGVAAVVERVHADEHVARTEHLGERESERQEDRVAGGNVRDRNVSGDVDSPVLRHRDVVGQRRPAERSQIDVDDAVLDRAQLCGNLGGGLELERVTLPVRGS